MDSDVQKIKDRLSIADVVGQHVQLRKAGKNLTARCPFHKERTPSFYISPERGTYICFGCGEKGDIFSFLQKIDGVDFPTALRQLASRAGVTLSKQPLKNPEQKEKEERLREVCEAAVAFYEHELTRHKEVQEYLKSRGIEEHTIAHWRIGYAPASWEELSSALQKQGYTKGELVEAGFAINSEKKPGEIFDRFRGRIIFPIFDISGQPIAVSGRFFEEVKGREGSPEPAKYVNSPETALFKKSRTLYGLDRARGAIRKADCILLVEGQFDLLMCHQSGLPFTVALSGTALTPEHLSLLGRLSKRLVLALDADQAGLNAGLKSAHVAINAGFDVKIPAFPQGKDPADLASENPELLKAAIRTSTSAVEFFLNRLQFSARDERGYKKIVEVEVLPLIAAMESRIDQEHFIAIVAGALHVPNEAVRSEVLKRKKSVRDDSSQDIHEASAELPTTLTALEKKIGMLLFYFPEHSPIGQQLRAVVGEPLTGLEQSLAHEAENLRFRFEAELGEHTTPEAIAEEILADIKKHLAKERFRKNFQ